MSSRFLGFCCVVLMMVLVVGVVQARSTYTVNVTADVNDGSCTVEHCSLREAIIAANNNPGEDTITLSTATYTLTIGGTNNDTSTSGDLDIRDHLIINGNGAASTIITVNYPPSSQDRVIHVDPLGTGITVSFFGLTIKGANTSAEGAGIYNRGNLSLSDVDVQSNRSNLQGGGIYNRGTLTINNSSIRNNIAHNEAAGIYNDTTGTLTINGSTISGNSTETYSGGAMRSKGVLTLTNTTISNNLAATTGAALVTEGTANLNNVTITNNQAGTKYTSGSTYVGGVYVLGGAFNLKNTILAGNTDKNRPGVKANCAGTLTSQDYNLIGQPNCVITGETSHNILGVDPMLYALEDNGGSTWTNLPQTGSPVIDGGNNSTCAATDQRGQPRPSDGNSDGTSACDIGAVEVVDFYPLVITHLNTNAPTADNSLVEGEAVSAAVHQLIVTFDHAVFDPPGDTAPDDVTNPANYIVVEAGNDEIFSTLSCQTGVSGDDSAISVDSAVYDSGTMRATVSVNGGTAFSPGKYRLLVCAVLHRTNGNLLDGNNDVTPGDDFIRSFSVDVPQSAPTFTVNTIIDSQDTLCGIDHCSLREAVIAANGSPGSTIVIAAGVYDLSLVGTGDDLSLTGDLDVLGNMTINGAGAADTIIRGSGDMVFDIRNSAIVTLQGVTIENGTNGTRVQDQANVTVVDSIFQDNLGRGIVTQGNFSSSVPRPRLEVTGTTITRNHGGIDAYQSFVTITNSTIVENDAGNSYGGGINLTGGGNLGINNTTIANNHANEGGGVRSLVGGYVQNSIIYGNHADVYGNNCRGSLGSAGNNLIGSDLPNLCTFRPLASDIVDLDPMLGPLQDNGGPTPTQALLIGSPAVSGGNLSTPGGGASSACLPLDQRGVPRYEGSCDIGAYQSQFAPYVTQVSAVTTPYSGQLAEGAETDVPITQLLITFSEPLQNPAGDSDPADVTNLANYRLFTNGADNIFQTSSCGTAQGDDASIALSSLTYANNTRLVTLGVNGGIPLPAENYRLVACQQLLDNVGNHLDGNRDEIAGDDFVRNFSIIPSQVGPTYTVNVMADEVDGVCGLLHCSLREAVMAANAASGANQINLPPGTYTFTRSGAGEDGAETGDLDIAGDLTIMGETGSEIDANHLDRALHILGAYSVTIQNVEIFNGFAESDNGGAIHNASGGTLTIIGSEIYENRANNGGAIYNVSGSTLYVTHSTLRHNVASTYDGGAIFNNATSNIDHSLLSANNAGEGAAIMSRGSLAVVNITNSALAHNTAVANGGAVDNDLGATLNIRNSTISSNGASRGGGIYHFSGTTTLNNVTISENSATNDGGGIYRNGNTVNISNSILAGNSDSSSSDSPNCWGTLTSQDYNLIDNVAGCTVTGATSHNIIGKPALISGLSYFEVETPVHIVLPGSPAIASGNPAAFGSGPYACEATDQRDVVRDDGVCDIGAYEEKLPIAVYNVNTVPDSGDGELAADEVVGIPITQILIKFTKPAQDPAGDTGSDDVTNPLNYRLIADGNNGTFQTSACGPAQGDDQSISINSVTYDTTNRIATLSVNGGSELPRDAYRLIACGTTTIRDQKGNALDGNTDGIPGDDFLRNFEIIPMQFGPVFQVVTTLDVNHGYCSYEDCSLRDAIIAANERPLSTINVPAGTYTLSLTGALEDQSATGDLDVAVKMTINGAGAGSTIINGGGIDRVLHVVSGDLSLYGVTIQGGAAPQYSDGGGIINSGTLSLIDSIVQSNQTNRSSGGGIKNIGELHITNSLIMANLANDGGGGGIQNTGQLTIVDSTISNNVATNGVVGGGGIQNENGQVSLERVTLSGNQAIGGGGIENRLSGSRLDINNSTISGNSAVYDGGGIKTSFGAVTNLNNTTIANNIADSDNDGSGQGGGIYNAFPNSSVNFHNTLIGNNIDRGGQTPDCGGEVALTSGDYNYIGTLTGCTLNGVTTHNISGVNILLGVLQINGGRTQTHALLAGSPAINAGDMEECPAVDQRGVARPQQSLCDIGAYEYATSTPPVLPMVVEIGSNADTGDGSLDENETTNADITQLTITFSQPMFDPIGNTDAQDVTNTANYWLVAAGADDAMQTDACGALLGDDLTVVVNNAAYSVSNYQVTLSINAASPLGLGVYRLIICGTLKSAAGASLDGNQDGTGGDSFRRNFTISPTLNGQILEVNTTSDSNDGVCSPTHCSLRDAILVANHSPAGSAIHVPAGTYTLTLAGNTEDDGLMGDLDILESMTIYGDGADVTIINANGLDRVFHMPNSNPGPNLYRNITLKGLTIEGGSANIGGGIYNTSPFSTVRIADSIVADNTATGNISTYFRSSGGGIINAGTMTIINSVIRDNTAPGNVGGGIANHQGVLTIENSTISGNSPGGVSADRSNVQGGYGTLVIRRSAIINNLGSGVDIDKNQATITNTTVSSNTGYGIAEGNNAAGWLSLNNVTITSNTKVGLWKAAPFADIRMTNTLIFANGGGDCDAGISFSALTLIEQDYNLVGSVGQRCQITGNHNLLGVDPLLGLLQLNGGPTQNHALQAGSPAINRGNIGSCETNDQRGYPRSAGQSCDIGAYEAQEADLNMNARPPLNYYTHSEITLSWGRVSWAQGYEVEISTTANFDNLVYSSGILDAETLEVTPSLEDGTYYWHVRAILDDVNSPWSQATQFTIQEAEE